MEIYTLDVYKTTESLVIKGFSAIQNLLRHNLGFQNCIKDGKNIDPPYNTGGDFVYPDDFHDSLENYKKITGQVDSNGNRISTNTEASGRYHTDWLNMMYPRLRLARNLLRDDGVIFISIDDNEVANLKKICDEIYGEANFRNFLTVRRYDKNINRQFMDSGLPSLNVGIEFILVYTKNETTKLSPVFREASDERASFGYWKGFWNNADRPTMRYDVLGFTPQSGQWKWSKELTEEAIKNYNEYEKNYSQEMTLEEYWELTGKDKRFIRRNPNGKGMNMGVEHWVAPSNNILRNSNWSDVFASKPTGVSVPFNNPKNYEMIAELCKLSGVENGEIVCDFFSGSATTAHAVFELAKEDIFARLILIQLPENLDINLQTASGDVKRSIQESIDFLDSINKPHFLTEIGKERIRRAGEKIKEENKDKDNIENLDIGFKVLKLDTSNIRKWQPDYDNLEQSILDYVDNYVDGRTEMDVVYEIMLKYGLDLTYPVNEFTIAKKKVYSIGFGMLMICLDNEITTEVAKGILDKVKELAPESTRVVFKDNGFKTDSNKTNIKEVLKCGGIEEFITL